MESLRNPPAKLSTKTGASKEPGENRGSQFDLLRKPLDDALHGRFAHVVFAAEVLVDTLLGNAVPQQGKVFLVHGYVPGIVDRQATL